MSSEDRLKKTCSARKRGRFPLPISCRCVTSKKEENIHPDLALYSQVQQPKAWLKPGRRRLQSMLRLAGKLLILTGVLLLLAFAFQVPYLYLLLTDDKASFLSIIIPALWRFGLILAGILLIRSGRKML